MRGVKILAKINDYRALQQQGCALCGQALLRQYVPMGGL